MKKMIISAVCAFVAAASVQAAMVGWSMTKTDAAYNGDAYQFFVVGQNGVTDVAAVTALLDQGKDVSSMVYGSGTLSGAGTATTSYSKSGKTLDEGNYTGFFVVYDSAAPKAGETKYVTTSGISVAIGASTANATFKAGDQSALVSSAANWKSFGTAVPEPCSVALIALGLAAFGLKRKVA